MNDLQKEKFDYLDNLRDSGLCNMLGATQYIIDEFDLTKSEAKKVLVSWLKQKKQDG